MEELLVVLKDLGVPSGVAGMFIFLAMAADKLIRSRTEGRKLVEEGDRAERLMLSSDQAAFRKSMFDQIDTLRLQLQDCRTMVEGAVARHLDAERRVVEFQLTIARLAAALIASGVTLPSVVVADLGLTPRLLDPPKVG